MAFDGITIHAITDNLRALLTNSRINKVAQPESDELLLTLKCTDGVMRRLVISANASLPLVYLTDDNKQSPATAPGFCMLLRKHLTNGRITEISQPGLERIIRISIEHLDEMGDLKTKTLVAELMGKHSNIILINDDNVIIDSIKHIGANVSSVRLVLPGKDYFVPENTKKKNPLTETHDGFTGTVSGAFPDASKAVSSSYEGISNFYAGNICIKAGVDPEKPLTDEKTEDLYFAFSDTVRCLNEGIYTYSIAYENNSPFEYGVLPLYGFSKECIKSFDAPSEMILSYYKEKEITGRMHQHSMDLRSIIKTILERDIKKYDLQTKQLKDTEKMGKIRLYGELLKTYSYSIDQGASSATLQDYNTGEDVTIPLDKDLSAIENANRYFDKYNKLKRTKEALSELTKEVKDEIDHLLSIQNSLNMARTLDDLAEIKEEMVLSGYIKKRSNEKKKSKRSVPLHYRTSDGFDIYVGKNNIQNEYITFELAHSSDYWFHAKKIPGSHVIVRSDQKDLPDHVFEDAAALAAYYSSADRSSKVEVDYVRRREVKHPNGSKPGFVVYYTNYSMMIEPSIDHLSLVFD